MRQLLGGLYQSGKWVTLHNKQPPGSPNATKADLLSKCRLAGSQSGSPPKDEQGSWPFPLWPRPGAVRFQGCHREEVRAGGVLLRPYSDAKIRGSEPLQEGQAFTFDEGALKQCEGWLFSHQYMNIFGTNRPDLWKWKSMMKRGCCKTRIQSSLTLVTSAQTLPK